MSALADAVHVDPAILGYVSQLAHESRQLRHVRLGLSVRGCLALRPRGQDLGARRRPRLRRPRRHQGAGHARPLPPAAARRRGRVLGRHRRRRHRPAARPGQAARRPWRLAMAGSRPGYRGCRAPGAGRLCCAPSGRRLARYHARRPRCHRHRRRRVAARPAPGLGGVVPGRGLLRHLAAAGGLLRRRPSWARRRHRARPGAGQRRLARRGPPGRRQPVADAAAPAQRRGAGRPPAARSSSSRRWRRAPATTSCSWCQLTGVPSSR